MNKFVFFVLVLVFLLRVDAFAQQTTVAVLPSEGTSLSNDELETLTDKMRETALKVLPVNTFTLLKQDAVIKRLGGMENYIKECSENSCIVDLGKKAQVDYVAQASVGKLDNKMRLKVELYSVSTEGLVGMLNDEVENFRSLLELVEKKVPGVFGKIPFAGGIGSVQTAGDWKFNGGKSYLANIITEPEGASLSFNGIPDSRCAKTPCKAQLAEGNVRIIANLEQYETVDTVILIKQNNQSVNIRLKANFGVLEIKPAYLEGISKNQQSWSLTINAKTYNSLENRLSPGKYEVKLSHECYEALSFNAGINKDKREIFNIADHIKLKNGGLVLSAEKGGEPVSEPVFANGTKIGETPFSGSVPVCTEIKIGEEKVNVKLKHNEKVEYTHKMQDDSPIPYYANYLQNPFPTTPPSPPPSLSLNPQPSPLVAEASTYKNSEPLEYESFKPLEYESSKPLEYKNSEPLNASSFYLSLNGGFVNSHSYGNREFRRTRINAIIGGEGIGNSGFGAGLFIGGGKLGDEIGEFILGTDFKKMFWLLNEWVAIPISFGIAWRMQWTEIENRIATTFIDSPEFLNEPEDYLNSKRVISRHNFDILPTIDLQIFISKGFSIYAGYMYDISFAGKWTTRYNGDSFKMPEFFNPLQNQKEHIFNPLRSKKEHLYGKPGSVRFGVKFH